MYIYPKKEGKEKRLAVATRQAPRDWRHLAAAAAIAAWALALTSLSRIDSAKSFLIGAQRNYGGAARQGRPQRREEIREPKDIYKTAGGGEKAMRRLFSPFGFNRLLSASRCT